MANTYTQLYIHLVFAVKFRARLIDSSWKNELYKYLCGIATNNKHKVYAINGMPDHIHILISAKPHISLSELVKDLKSSSSKWINEKNLAKGKFLWQEGFGAFSYSQSSLSNVIAYIENQEAHHSKTTFKKEYTDILNAFKVDYDEKYIFEATTGN
jgi:putative transposase